VSRKKKHEEHVNHERWLVSYADFITLLFATFTALFAISNADMEKFKEMAKSMNQAFNGKPTVAPIISLDSNAKGSGDLVINVVDSPFSKPNKTVGEGGSRRGDGDAKFDPVEQIEAKLSGGGKDDGGDGKAGATPAPTPEPVLTAVELTGQEGGGDQTQSTPLGAPEGKANDVLASRITQLLHTANLSDKVVVRKDERGTVISLSEAGFFEPGGFDVLPQSIHTLDRVLNTLRDKDFEIRVEGHTDNMPVGAGQIYRNNEELSALRASRVMELMIREYRFSGDRLSVSGFGPWRPIADNSTAQGRGRNRRVDIVVLNKNEISKEPH
jgi:chemotaxis protein MotB